MSEAGTGVLVVARWQEDVSWAVRSPWPVRVVQKDRDVPNVGREAASYLWFLATQPIDPDTVYGFVQGDPWPHGFAWEQLGRVDGYTPLGLHVLTEDGEGRPNHPGLPLVQCLRDWLGVAQAPAQFITRAGAQFLVPGHVILQRPRAWYAELQRIVSQHGTGPWVMERLWPHVWTPQALAGVPTPTPTEQRPMLDLMQAIHRGNVYAGLRLPERLDLQGWNGDGPIFEQVLAEVQAQLVVEVGSWKGQSAATMGRWLRGRGTLVCVDTWLGAREFHDDPTRHGWLACEHGYPTVYRTFLGNMAHLGLQDTVVPFPQCSLTAARWLREHGVQPDVVYVDASHDEEDVALDLRAWWRVLRPGGIMFGDDHDPAHWPGVVAAVGAFAEEQGLVPELVGTHWVLRKPGQGTGQQ